MIMLSKETPSQIKVYRYGLVAVSGQFHVHKRQIIDLCACIRVRVGHSDNSHGSNCGASEHSKPFWLSATSSSGACVTNTRVQFCDELVHFKYFELLQPWRRQHPRQRSFIVARILSIIAVRLWFLTRGRTSAREKHQKHVGARLRHSHTH